MFTSFDYYEQKEKLASPLKNPSLFKQELDIIEKFARNHISKEKEDIYCPACKEKHNILFFKKWDVDYYRCPNCFTIFNYIDVEYMEEYKTDETLVALRTKEEYQLDTSSRRMFLWDDLLDWYKFRCFRYLKKNQNLCIIDYGTRYFELIRLIRDSGLASDYELRNSIINLESNGKVESADVILCMDYIQQEQFPIQFLKKINAELKEEGLLFFSTRMGSGIDVLTLKGNNNGIFPYEFNLLPTPLGLEFMFEDAGFQILELTTPGVLDVSYLFEQLECLEENNTFLYYFLKNAKENDLAEFQRFLQKSSMSSYAQLVARKVK